jgi:hypothetical protein
LIQLSSGSASRRKSASGDGRMFGLHGGRRVASSQAVLASGGVGAQG